MDKRFHAQVKRHIYQDLLRHFLWVLTHYRPVCWGKEWAKVAGSIIFVNQGYTRKGLLFSLLKRSKQVRLRIQRHEESYEAYCREMMQDMY